MNYEYYDRIRQLKARFKSISGSYSRLCHLMQEQAVNLQFDPGFSFRHIAALIEIWHQVKEIINITIALHNYSSLTSRSDDKILIHPDQRIPSITGLHDIVPSVLRNERLLNTAIYICTYCFRSDKILENMVAFACNLDKIINGLRFINESYVVYECIRPDGSVDFSNL